MSITKVLNEIYVSKELSSEIIYFFDKIEINTIKVLYDFPAVLSEASREYSPAVICQYCLDLARAYNRLYNEVSILRETDEGLQSMRLKLAHHTAEGLKFGLNLLGINVVERM
jgi:arginyl-tRNA synthetase